MNLEISITVFFKFRNLEKSYLYPLMLLMMARI